MTSSSHGGGGEGFLLLIVASLFALTVATAFGVEISHLLAHAAQALDGAGRGSR